MARARGVASKMVETIPAKIECHYDIFRQCAGLRWSGRHDLWLDGRKFIVTMVSGGGHQLIRNAIKHAKETYKNPAQSMADRGAYFRDGRLRHCHDYGIYGVRFPAIARLGVGSTLDVVAANSHIKSSDLFCDS